MITVTLILAALSLFIAIDEAESNTAAPVRVRRPPPEDPTRRRR